MAAKVTLSFVAFGCGGAAEDSTPDAEAFSDAGHTPSDAMLHDALVDVVADTTVDVADAEPTCEVPADPATASPQTRECCDARLVGVTLDDGSIDREAVSQDDVRACCKVIVARPDDERTFIACCEAFMNDIPGCTPWGPPVPPSMPPFEGVA